MSHFHGPYVTHATIANVKQQKEVNATHALT